MVSIVPKVQFVSVLLTASITLACGEPASPAPVVSSVVVTPGAVSACSGDTTRVLARANDASGLQINGAPLAWSSSAPGVATVDSAGLVRAVSGGNAVIRASAGTVHGEAVVRVRAPRIAFGRKYPSLFVDDTTLVTASVTDTNSGLAPAGPPSWQSRATAVAEVTGAGVVGGLTAGSSDLVATGICAVRDSITVVVLTPRIGVNRELSYFSETMLPDGSYVPIVRIVRDDGTGAQTISAAGAWAAELAWAPNGARIVLTYAGENLSESFLADPDGSNASPLGEQLINPEWSPDGTRIAFRDYITSGESDLHSRAPDGANRRRLTAAGGDDGEPHWSPDGRRIAYTRGYGATEELWVMAADSSDRRRITLPTRARNLRWSPDGKLIAFDNGFGVWTVGSEGSNLRSLTPNCTPGGACGSAETNEHPAWHPRGDSIAWVRAAGGQLYIVVAGADGGAPNPIPVRDACCFESGPQWSPDGTLIAFSSTRPDDPFFPGVAVMTAAGTALRYVTGTENAGAPRWRP